MLPRLTFTRPFNLASPWFRTASLLSGCAVVTLWTVLRHISNGVNFDVVGQVGLVEQWSHGFHGGAQVGSTNYILKMPLYWVVNHLHFLGYHGKLLVLALLCNLATFIFIFILLSKFLDLYEVRQRAWAYLGFLWLATIAGSVYWLDYANSRNLETAGGLLFMYLSLVFLARPSAKRALGLAATGGIVFFADPLQLYVIALPLSIFALLYWAVKRTKLAAQAAAGLSLASLFGFAIAKALFALAAALLPVSFLRLPAHYPAWSLTTVATSARETGINTLKVFGADILKRPYGLNAVRELINLVILGGILVIVIKALRAGKQHQLLAALGTVAAVNYMVYIATGQALQWETSRYLLMLPLLAVVFIGIYAPVVLIKKLWLQTAMCVALILSIVLLFGALVISWPARFSKDIPTEMAATYLQTHHYHYALASREIAITSTYYAAQQAFVLPFICTNSQQLQFSNLFFDSGPLAKLSTAGVVPLLIENGGIKSDANTCDRAAILSQFGTPVREESLPGFGLAEIYQSSQLHLKD